MTEQFYIVWVDAGQEPRHPANPAYPQGIDIDVAGSQTPRCTTALPYPARRIGGYDVTCTLCGLRVACSTAGRTDDPRSLTVPCKRVPDRQLN